jgi:hypothetical protein
MDDPPPWLSPDRTAWVAVWMPWATCWERRMRRAQSGASPEEAGLLDGAGPELLAAASPDVSAERCKGDVAAAPAALATPPKPLPTPERPDWPAAPAL